MAYEAMFATLFVLDIKKIQGVKAAPKGDKEVSTMCGSRTGGWSLPCVLSD
jgi:hypothetical protein